MAHAHPNLNLGRVLIAGAGVTGKSAGKALAPLCDAMITDANSTALHKAAEEIRRHSADGVDGADITPIAPEEIDWEQVDLVVTSPGWAPNSPLLVEAAAHGVEVIGDVELAWRLDQAEVFGPKRTWIAITGTNGKSTTTAMLETMLQAGGLKAQAVGNIGVAVLDAVVGTQRIDVLATELSSFQLHWTNTFVPDVGVFLNVAEDHLDWHGSFDAYAQDKAKVWKAPIAIAGVDDPTVAAMAAQAPKAITAFTLATPEPGQFGVAGGNLVDGQGRVIAPAEGIDPAGPAGVLDALAASAAALAVGVEHAAIAQALSTFRVAQHRGQTVGSARGIVAIDNSKATNPHAADSALAGFESVIWVAGGQLKGADVAPLVRAHAHRFKAVALLGQDRELFAQAISAHAPQARLMLTEQTEPGAAMDEVVAWAVAQADPGDAIVLAPAAASLDMYSGMGQRGDMFAEAITRELED
ncbi:UDP-N-acetylmuramoyl-L-alanine--D-glutamate ligase [Corynebacterium sp. 153RC1]|uniref:UDP-N-acetylmuramoyl-L-alanine--D-glutamate ligase n=1 Tax=unclassified Corynebacterium TaxID=2624378 RepID=UPI00211C37D4|nr:MULTISPECIES: UDP-N-acetylmuramoyl-L-alanine--D-glutamate ligase [unclassified Corynebacterium]MCQ9352248.1 UDP-N-acetylmuramoyl-L-alanine--D-glutamate ligase [Corynebacterium sp. 209RC1]MCQ9355448.1 UDP-N-acetylmuramoyl-L-alanine--D-glutamate ligase [Corynebacterium sp. 1222RC1]MCQ9356644.1 UDP-N-acetylmuramoyl-L-alanine--D-glutamate ligase [Corynebacterium sp. 122RC1]MCQ9359815.1 UDP-N-acetylmuramoyl-L-alanine--D-glutamate ligase [Corynebacterium sp. 142RC1]MCQ9360596.1 UDP-N-acetylmuramo